MFTVSAMDGVSPNIYLEGVSGELLTGEFLITNFSPDETYTLQSNTLEYITSCCDMLDSDRVDLDLEIDFRQHHYQVAQLSHQTYLHLL